MVPLLDAGNRGVDRQNFDGFFVGLFDGPPQTRQSENYFSWFDGFLRWFSDGFDGFLLASFLMARLMVLMVFMPLMVLMVL